MDTNDNATDLLLETIRKELNSIINDRQQNISKPAAATTSKPIRAEKFKRTSKISKPDDHSERGGGTTSQSAGIEGSNTGDSTPATFLENQTSQNIDESLQKMQLDLKQSYELFQSVGEKFETINFGCLKNRIKDLHLSTNNAAVQNLKDILQQSFTDNSVDQLTTEMGEQFRKLPGEFGGIPEVSAFFKACTQLQHGLERLKRQRNEISDLGNRMSWATEMNYNRIEEIHKTLDKKA